MTSVAVHDPIRPASPTALQALRSIRSRVPRVLGVLGLCTRAIGEDERREDMRSGELAGAGRCIEDGLPVRVGVHSIRLGTTHWLELA